MGSLDVSTAFSANIERSHFSATRFFFMRLFFPFWPPIWRDDSMYPSNNALNSCLGSAVETTAVHHFLPRVLDIPLNS